MEAFCDDADLHLRQSKYILDLLHEPGMMGAKPYSAPCTSGSKLFAHEGTPLSNSKVSNYRQLVGSLQYCTLTHPDIQVLCQFMHSPTSAHWMAVKQVLHYLKGTIDNGLLSKRTYST